MKKAFTLMELLIVFSILAILSLVVIITINQRGQLNKAFDTKRQKNLDDLRKSFEEFYNDNGCYPQPEDVCYSSSNYTKVCSGSNIRSIICNICDSASSTKLKPYLSIPCDPEQSNYNYLYEVEANTAVSCAGCTINSSCRSSCPQKYGVYSVLSVPGSYAKGALGFQTADLVNPPSSIRNPFGYDYAVSSPNYSPSSSTQLACVTNGNPALCNNCGTTYQECIISSNNCQTDKVYGTRDICCSNNIDACP